MATYTQNAADSRWECEQWTGDIQPIRRLINQNVKPRGSRDEGITKADLPDLRYQVHDGSDNPTMAGWLCVWQYQRFALDIPPNYWVVYGPVIRGTKGGGKIRLVSPEEFSSEFTIV